MAFLQVSKIWNIVPADIEPGKLSGIQLAERRNGADIVAADVEISQEGKFDSRDGN